MYVHPYAIVTSVALFIGVFYSLRNPLFAIFVAFISFVLVDYFLKKRMRDGDK